MTDDEGDNNIIHLTEGDRPTTLLLLLLSSFVPYPTYHTAAVRLPARTPPAKEPQPQRASSNRSKLARETCHYPPVGLSLRPPRFHTRHGVLAKETPAGDTSPRCRPPRIARRRRSPLAAMALPDGTAGISDIPHRGGFPEKAAAGGDRPSCFVAAHHHGTANGTNDGAALPPART